MASKRCSRALACPTLICLAKLVSLRWLLRCVLFMTFHDCCLSSWLIGCRGACNYSVPNFISTSTSHSSVVLANVFSVSVNVSHRSPPRCWAHMQPLQTTCPPLPPISQPFRATFCFSFHCAVILPCLPLSAFLSFLQFGLYIFIWSSHVAREQVMQQALQSCS